MIDRGKQATGYYADVFVGEDWCTFKNFLADMGERPEGMTLDRIDPYGNYEPGNCRWASWNVQASNKRQKIAA